MNTSRTAILSMMAVMSAPLAYAVGEEGMEEVDSLRVPASSVSVGGAYSSDDLHQLGRYNGREDSGVYPLLDFDINQRDEESGTWTRVDGQSVGFSNRSLRYERNRQGSWNYFIEYDQLESINPYIYDTDLGGIGTNAQTTNNPVHREQFSQERKNLEFGMSRYFSDWSKVSLRYKQENKEGNRAWGTASHLFIAEPIDYRTREFEATVDYNLDALQLRTGYLLSLFDNPIQSVTQGSTETATPPDNKSHSVFLSGGYDFSDATRASFKVSRTRDLQDELFFAPAASIAALSSSLDGKVDTTRVNLGVVSRVLPQLTVKAKYRYEDRDDKTPQYVFLANNTRLNQLTSRTTVNGTLEGVYRLQDGISVTAGVDQENWRRIVTDNPNMAKRHKTDETTLRVGARKALSDTVNGSVRVSHSKRDGSEWLPSPNTALTPPIRVNPIQWSDRDRDALRAMLDWYPTEKLSTQFTVQTTRDEYSGEGELGPQDGSSWLASVDTGYALTDEWSLNGWASYSVTKINQSTQAGTAATSLIWGIEMEDTSVAVGAGLKGQPSDVLELGLNLEVARDTSKFPMYDILNGPSTLDDLPEVTYRRAMVKLYAEYDLDEHAGVRVDYRYDRVTNDDWLWSDYNYGGTTTVTQLDRETNHFIGLTYYYRGW